MHFDTLSHSRLYKHERIMIFFNLPNKNADSAFIAAGHVYAHVFKCGRIAARGRISKMHEWQRVLCRSVVVAMQRGLPSAFDGVGCTNERKTK